MLGKNTSIALIIVVAVLLGLGGILFFQGTPMQNGKELVEAMHDKYADSWYNYLTFRQETIYYKDGKEDFVQTWYEALSAPGKLVIKFDSLGSSSGIVFRQDSQYVFRNNELVQSVPRVHDLLVLGFDVYAQSPEKTIQKLQNRGFDLSKMYETTWQGRPVFVVGAENKDDQSPQFWIDKEHLYFVRLIRKNEEGQLQETEFNNYERIGDGWVAPEVVFKSDGEIVVREEYYDMQVPDQIPESVFDIEDFRQARW